MNANEYRVWLVVAVLAFLIGQGRIRHQCAPASRSMRTRMRELRAPGSATTQYIVRIYRAHTLERLTKFYNMEELRTLSFDIGLLHEEIAGDTLSEYAMELLAYCERRGLLRELLAGMR